MMKVGMVGVGAISGIYLENITKHFPEIELVAVCDLIKERAKSAKERYNVPKIYDTMEELFADDEIDIVLNLTRPYEHFEVSKGALLAGKHVYSEKPLGASFEEGLELVRIAKEQNRMIGGAPDTFLGAGIQTCRKLIDSGMIGEPVGAAAFMICRGHESWHPDPDFYYQYGGGPMMDMGPYYVTALVNLLGGVKAITGVTKTPFATRMITSEPHAGETIQVNVPTSVMGMLHFDSGIVGTIFTTFDVYYPTQPRFEIYGSEGTLIVPDPNGFGGPIKLFHSRDHEMKELPLLFDYEENSRALGLADMAKALETGRDPRASYEQTLHVLEILTAFKKSSDEQKTIPLTTHFERKAPMKPAVLKGVLD